MLPVYFVTDVPGCSCPSMIDRNLKVDAKLAQLQEESGGNALELSRNVQLWNAYVKHSGLDTWCPGDPSEFLAVF